MKLNIFNNFTELTQFFKIQNPPQETATIVFDMTGTSLKNIDMTSVKFMVNTLAVCFFLFF